MSGWRADGPRRYVASSLVLIGFLQAASAMADRYALPRTKAAIEPCRDAALALHAGQVIDVRVENREGTLYFNFDIQAPDGVRWKIHCEGSTATIVREQRQEDPR